MKRSILIALALAGAALALAGCKEEPVTDTIILRMKNGCEVHEISQGFWSETVYVTTCPNGQVKTSWSTTQQVGDVPVTKRHEVETTVR